jgi:hypothetical protein
MNAGDIFYNNKILSHIFSKDLTGVEIIYGDAIDSFGDFFIYKKAGDLQKLRKGMNIRHQAVFIRTSILKSNPFDINYSIAADFDLIYKLYQERKNFYYIHQPLVLYDIHGLSNTRILKATAEEYKISRNYTEYNTGRYIWFYMRFLWHTMIYIARLLLPAFIYRWLIRVVNRKNLVTIPIKAN